MTLTFEKIAELEQEYGTTMDVNFEMTECPRSCEICQEEAEAELRAHLKKRAALIKQIDGCVAGTCDTILSGHLSTCKNLAAAYDAIDKLGHFDMCRLWRFGAKTHGYRSDYFQGDVGAYFKSRLFNHFGGFTTAISKELGWEA